METAALLVNAQLASPGLLRTTLENVIAHQALTPMDLSALTLLVATGNKLSSHACAMLVNTGSLACSSASTFLTVILASGIKTRTSASALTTSTSTVWCHSALMLALTNALPTVKSKILRHANA